MNTNSCNELILVPTEFEKRFVGDFDRDSSEVRVCGFGPVTSGIVTARLIAELNPKKVLLIGIAGGYSDKIELGTAIEFSEVWIDGVGCGAQEHFQSAGAMGWKQYVDGDLEIGDCLALDEGHVSDSGEGFSLLTVCSASADLTTVEQRLRRFPGVVAEDMESFSVAAACKIAGKSLRVVRGISNRAGDRDKSNWCIEEAMDSVGQLISKST